MQKIFQRSQDLIVFVLAETLQKLVLSYEVPTLQQLDSQDEQILLDFQRPVFDDAFTEYPHKVDFKQNVLALNQIEAQHAFLELLGTLILSRLRQFVRQNLRVPRRRFRLGSRGRASHKLDENLQHDVNQLRRNVVGFYQQKLADGSVEPDLLQVLVVFKVLLGLTVVHLHDDVDQILELELAADSVLLAIQVLVYYAFGEFGLL